MKLSIAGKGGPSANPFADTVDVVHYLTYTDIIILLSSGDSSCADLAQRWLDMLR